MRADREVRVRRQEDVKALLREYENAATNQRRRLVHLQNRQRRNGHVRKSLPRKQVAKVSLNLADECPRWDQVDVGGDL